MTDLATPRLEIPDDIASLSPAAKRRLRWVLQARDKQLTPEGDWLIWAIISGRGFGKTRVGAEDTADFNRKNPNSRIPIVVPTFAMGRDVCVEGESGLLSVLAEEEIAQWNRSEGQLVLTNGSRWKIFSAEKPNTLRGWQSHRAWCEEMGSWPYLQDTWDMLMFGLRLGEHPQVVVTTTPKPYRLIKDILKRESTHVTVGGTFENAENLSAVMLEELQRRYGGTALGRQELEGEIVEDVEGALWARDTIEDTRRDAPKDLDRIVVAVDPASGKTGDETGIIVVGSAGEHAYVLEDLSLRGSPDVWATAAVAAFVHWKADTIVYEANMGGEMAAASLRAACKDLGVTLGKLNLRPVWASRGKRTRAEPIAIAYTPPGGRIVHHVRAFPELEDQMCTWVPGEPSPDRMDAAVWGLTHIFENMRTSRRKLRFVS